jgi:multidrug efflux pump subunit AcrA (membrane-fusion protein)
MRLNARGWAAIIVLLVAVSLVIALRPKHEVASVAQAPAVSLATAQRTLFHVHVTVHGRVGPPPGSLSQLAFAVSGRIERFDVKVGDRVSAGQPLAELDARPYAFAVSQARGDLQAGSYTAQSDLAAAQAAEKQAQLRVAADNANLQREQTLYQAGIAAAKDVAAARTQLATDQADAQSARVKVETAAATISSENRGQALRARATLAIAEQNLEYTTLKAPNDGVVAAILKHVGESVDPATPVISLAPPLERTATFSVAAPIAGQIHAGDPVAGRLTSSGETFNGRVTASVAAVDPSTQTATVVIDGVPKDAVGGEAVDATITVALREALVVPTSAVVQDPESGNTLVFVADEGAGPPKFNPRVVRVGASDQAFTEIRSGLKPGERVASQGAFELLAPAQGGS